MTQSEGPPTLREAIKAFREAQEQRVNHWKEYDEALAIFKAQEVGQGRPQNGNNINGASDHYRTGPIPISDDVFSKIVSLVTSGLLDSSHSVRAVETEVRSTFHQPRIADLIGKVQDLENAVLRNIVQRDQQTRTAMVEGRQEDTMQIQSFNENVHRSREEIQDLMSEINAEMAELDEA